LIEENVETAKCVEVPVQVWTLVKYSVSLKLLALAIVICVGFVGLFPFHVAAETTTTYYLHAPQCSQTASGNLTLDGQQPGGAATCSLLVAAGSNADWTTSPFTVATVFPAGNWNVSLWLNTTGTMTQYNLTLAIIDPAGNLTQIGTGFSPAINSSIPTQYNVSIPAPMNSTFNVDDSLTFWLLNDNQYGNSTDPGFIFLDSAEAPSEITAPAPVSNISASAQALSVTSASNMTQTNSTTQSNATLIAQTLSVTTTTSNITRTNSTTTQSSTTTTAQTLTSTTRSLVVTTQSQPVTTLSQPTTATLQPTLITSIQPSSSNLAWPLALVGVGASVALLLGAWAFRSTSRSDRIIIHAGRYYCRKHRVPLTNAYGTFWCPYERTPLKP